jgi:hypothetical protein
MSVDFSYANISHYPLLKPMALAVLWRHRTSKAIRQWQQYLDERGLLNTAINEQLGHALEQLAKIRYTVALVAEVSRGKSELINAMLFAQHGTRIVPSGAGRTTMCPTEFFCDEDVPPYLELLPIETRAHKTSFVQLSNTPSAWQRFDLNGDDTEVLSLALQKMCAKQKVSLAQAQTLGFELDSFDHGDSDALNDVSLGATGTSNVMIEIPLWRYARLNIHHPLLATGLAILDTPGLNVLGHEPELTHAILPTVDSVVYLLAADVGVSRSDQLAWATHLSHLPEHSKLGVLNKIDALGDGLRSALDINIDIVRQMDQCAQALNLPKSQVFAISARQAMIARTKQDDAQLEQSRLPQLEQALTTQVLEKRQMLLKASTLRALALSHQEASQQLENLALQTLTQLDELKGLSASKDPKQMMLVYAADTKKRFALEVAFSQMTQQTMHKHRSTALNQLVTQEVHRVFDDLITSCHSASASALKRQLNTTLVELHAQLSGALQQSQTAMAFAYKTLLKLHRLDYSTATKKSQQKSTYESLAHDALTDAQVEMSINAYLAELARLGQMSGSFLPALPFLSATQRMKAAQTVLALQQRCELIISEGKDLIQRWFAQMNRVLENALNLHRAQLNKRADTLERMHQAQQALSTSMSSQGATLDGMTVQLNELDSRYQRALEMISADKQVSQTKPSSQSSAGGKAIGDVRPTHRMLI